jgi:hypothetical protein
MDTRWVTSAFFVEVMGERIQLAAHLIELVDFAGGRSRVK